MELQDCAKVLKWESNYFLIPKFVNKVGHQLLRVRKGELQIKLDGYASSSADEKTNDKVAAQRIAAVRYYLGTKHNIHRNNFATENHGEYDSDQAVIDAFDRQVIISFVKPKS